MLQICEGINCTTRNGLCKQAKSQELISAEFVMKENKNTTNCEQNNDLTFKAYCPLGQQVEQSTQSTHALQQDYKPWQNLQYKGLEKGLNFMLNR